MTMSTCLRSNNHIQPTAKSSYWSFHKSYKFAIILVYSISKVIHMGRQAKREIIRNDRREKIKTFQSKANVIIMNDYAETDPFFQN